MYCLMHFISTFAFFLMVNNGIFQTSYDEPMSSSHAIFEQKAPSSSEKF